MREQFQNWYRETARLMLERVEERKRELGVDALPDHEWRCIESVIRSERPQPK